MPSNLGYVENRRALSTHFCSLFCVNFAIFCNLHKELCVDFNNLYDLTYLSEGEK